MQIFANIADIAKNIAKEEADIARERNDFRTLRLDREKKERAERNAKRKLESSSLDKSKLIDEKRAEIAAAMNRINKDEKIK